MSNTSISRRGPNNGLGGRPKGATNIATREFREFWAKWFHSADYVENAKRRMLIGDANHLETYLLGLVYGKPKETIDLNVRGGIEDLSNLSLEELTERAEVLMHELREANEVNDALPAEYRVEEAASTSREFS
jgi:hypothetical protein